MGRSAGTVLPCVCDVQMVSLVVPPVKRGAFGKGLRPNPRTRQRAVMRYYVADPAHVAPHSLPMTDFTKLIARLQKHYGAPELPPARGAFELVLWENACYLLPDQRRAAVFEARRAQVGLTADAILQAPREVLLPLAAMGGMRSETRVFRWQEIARITATQFEGNLEQILEWPYAQAKKALKLFPTIGDPGMPGVPLKVAAPL
jgi:hypothetical protein